MLLSLPKLRYGLLPLFRRNEDHMFLVLLEYLASSADPVGTFSGYKLSWTLGLTL